MEWEEEPPEKEEEMVVEAIDPDAIANRHQDAGIRMEWFAQANSPPGIVAAEEMETEVERYYSVADFVDEQAKQWDLPMPMLLPCLDRGDHEGRYQLRKGPIGGTYYDVTDVDMGVMSEQEVAFTKATFRQHLHRLWAVCEGERTRIYPPALTAEDILRRCNAQGAANARKLSDEVKDAVAAEQEIGRDNAFVQRIMPIFLALDEEVHAGTQSVTVSPDADSTDVSSCQESGGPCRKHIELQEAKLMAKIKREGQGVPPTDVVPVMSSSKPEVRAKKSKTAKTKAEVVTATSSKRQGRSQNRVPLEVVPPAKTKAFIVSRMATDEEALELMQSSDQAMCAALMRGAADYNPANPVRLWALSKLPENERVTLREAHQRALKSQRIDEQMQGQVSSGIRCLSPA